ncbi:MAG: endolytic transglycosylase MltG [Defluviitaleaceae bacterium]|nr:endolytic transglycosylase MltG [Defluviitaleaceae bacterium]
MRTNWLIDILQFLLGMFVNVGLLLIVAYLVYIFALRGFAFGEDFSAKMTEEKPSVEIEFVLEEDTPAAEVAMMLEERGVISNQYLFRLELFLKDSSKFYKAGTYILDQNMSNTQVNVTLRARPEEILPDNMITIPEGYTIRDIATYLEARELMTAEEFIEACENYSVAYHFLAELPDRPNRLEGYLFPDTYFITSNATPEDIIGKMLSRFDEIFNYEYRIRARELGMSIDEVITKASIIEREVRMHSERVIVSGVIDNRLKRGMLLQMDATVQYALDKRKERLTLEDLEINSPYNTYVYTGLPIGPIANPGAECIRAALFPEFPGDREYLYYVLTDAETGEHYFTHDYDDFLRVKANYGQ